MRTVQITIACTKREREREREKMGIHKRDIDMTSADHDGKNITIGHHMNMPVDHHSGIDTALGHHVGSYMRAGHDGTSTKAERERERERGREGQAGRQADGETKRGVVGVVDCRCTDSQ